MSNLEHSDDPSFVTMDLDKLFSPISVELTAGESLRYEGTYDRIRAARHEDDNLEQGIYQADRKHADWRLVNDLCIEALETQTKDLQIATWLTEAWIHLYGFVGLREGCRLIVGLCESFWDDLYPELDDNGDVENRIAPIHWMNEKFPLNLKLVKVTHPETGDTRSYCWADWDSACRLDLMGKRDPSILKSAEAKDKVSQAEVLGSVMLTPLSFFRNLDEELSQSRESVINLERLLDGKCGKEAPGLLQIKDTVEKTQRFVHDILKERETEESPTEIYLEENNGETQSNDDDERPVWSGSAIRSRTEAYQRLSEAADYLLRTEPHSPAPYLIKRAVAWGSMSLSELFQEIVRNEGEMNELNQLLGFIDQKDLH